MNNNLEEIISNLPHKVKFEEIIDFDDLDQRVSYVENITVNIIGINDGFIEFCPNDAPPSLKEILPWIWIYRPDLGNEIVKKTDSEDFKMLIECYNNNTMDQWWEHMS